MSREHFDALIATVTAAIADVPLDAGLSAELERRFPPDGEVVRALEKACQEGIAEGWMCSREAAGIKFGRVTKPSEATHRFSVDVVDMPSLAGPHHRHPKGEIDLIMPVDSGARFDGHPRGWLVYPAESAHAPTVQGGRAIILYLLPEGEIDFTRAS